MNAREEAGNISRQLQAHRPIKWLLTGGVRRRTKILEWLKYYGVDANRVMNNTYLLTKRRFMGGPIKNPQTSCEYCKVIDAAYRQASTPKEKRRALARFKLHKRALHRNPPSKMRVKMARVSGKLAYKLYKHFKTSGVPQFVWKRVPASIKPYVKVILEANNVKILKVLFVLVCLGGVARADTALIQLGPDGRPLALTIPGNTTVPDTTTVSQVQIVTSTPTPAPAASPTDVGTLPPVFPQSYIYFTIPSPVGPVNLVTPWSAAIAAEGYDFIGKEAITQGYVPLVQYKKVTGVFGAGINGRGEGAPLAGALIDLAAVPLTASADLHFIVSGGYNFNEKHALAIFSGSVQFLK